MNEFLPIMSGLVLGAALGYVRPERRGRVAIVVGLLLRSLPLSSAASIAKAGRMCSSTQPWLPSLPPYRLAWCAACLGRIDSNLVAKLTSNRRAGIR
jgi:hypothetical protein